MYKRQTRYYASTDAQRGSGDVLLTGSRSVIALAAGATSSGSSAVTIPATLPLGSYRVLACADDVLKVRESSETNNCTASPTPLLVAVPDLRTTAVSAPPAGVAPGGKFAVTDTVMNDGNATAAATTTRYYLSHDPSRDASDVLLTGTRAVTSLAGGASSSGSKTVTVPLAAPEGTYYLFACADDLLKVAEASEANNCLATAATVLVGLPDLVVTAISEPPTDTVVGGKFAITDTTANVGNVTAVATATRYYLSLDTAKSADDVVFATARSVVSLGPGASSSGSRTVTVPLGTGLGSYYVLACGDQQLKVAERDEANNCRASSAQVTVR